MLTGAGISFACCVVGYAALTVHRVQACSERERKRPMLCPIELSPLFFCLICRRPMDPDHPGLLVFGDGKPVGYLCRKHLPWGFVYAGPGRA